MTTQDDYKRALEVLDQIFFDNHGNRQYWEQEAINQYETIRQALQSKIGADGWMPIETAPRDGTEIDIWFSSDSGGYRIANCKYIDEQWYNYTLDEEFHEMDWMPVYDQQSALYWMPLPPAPRKEGE